MNKTNLILFFKEPLIGKVKTRLAKDIGHHNATELYKTLLKTHLEVLKKLNNVISHFFISDSPTPHFQSIFQKLWGPLHVQSGDNLGERMENAIKQVQRGNSFPTLILGSDTAFISDKDILEAIEYLKSSEIVLGSTEDGGYYLMGFRHYVKNIFSKIEWSSEKVLEQQIQNIKSHNLTFSFSKTKFDIDTLVDYQKYMKMLK